MYSIKFTLYNICIQYYCCFPESRKWSKLETSGQHVPSPRAAHVSTCYNDEMFVFGGRDSKARTQVQNGIPKDFQQPSWCNGILLAMTNPLNALFCRKQ